MATTMATSVNEILKEDIMRGICVESLAGPDEGNKDAAVPFYKKLGGLPNLGKTYFYCQDELERYRKWVEA